MVGQALVAVEQVDDAAIGEAVLRYDVLHDAIVAMGIYPQVGQLLIAPVKASAGYAVAIGRTGQPMDDTVWPCIVEPCTTVDAGIGWLACEDEGKGSYHQAIGLGDDVTVAIGYLPTDLCFRRVTAGPLIEVAAIAHNTPSCIKELHHTGKVSEGSFTDVHHTGDYFLGYRLQERKPSGEVGFDKIPSFGISELLIAEEAVVQVNLLLEVLFLFFQYLIAVASFLAYLL